MTAEHQPKAHRDPWADTVACVPMGRPGDCQLDPPPTRSGDGDPVAALALLAALVVTRLTQTRNRTATYRPQHRATVGV